GQPVIDRQRVNERVFRQWHRFVRSGETVKRQSDVGIGQTGIGQREVWILFDRLFEFRDAPVESVLSSFVPKIAALQIKLIGLSVSCIAPDEPLLLVTGEPNS